MSSLAVPTPPDLSPACRARSTAPAQSPSTTLLVADDLLGLDGHTTDGDGPGVMRFVSRRWVMQKLISAACVQHHKIT